MNEKDLKPGVIFALIGAFIMLVGCGPDPKPKPKDGAGGIQKTVCGNLEVDLGNGLGPVAFWPIGDTYGLNAFYVWQIDDASVPPHEEYYFRSTGELVEPWVPTKNWQIPTTWWSAVRLGLDGLDPHEFTEQDPFFLWYLPYTPGTSWQSKTGARNDGTCPNNNTIVNGRPRCADTNQLDPNAPSLVAGETYMFRMVMIIPLGSSGDTKQNRVMSCYEKIMRYP